MPNINKDKLHDLTKLIFRTAGATDDHASQVADVLIANNLAGHGFMRLEWRN
jgi:LDH2 family malate/lactate/ureidoglycolate dehydrogenase